MAPPNSQEKAKAYCIIDNKSAEFASWNPEDLSLEMREPANLTTMNEFFFRVIDQQEAEGSSRGGLPERHGKSADLLRETAVILA